MENKDLEIDESLVTENENEEENKRALLIASRRKRRKWRLLILLLLLCGTGTMLATSTYAWFTSNKAVSVQTFKVNIAAKNGIQVSADGTKWKSIVQTSDLTSVHGTTYTSSVNQIPSNLEPVSSVGTITSGKMEMFYGTVTTNTAGTDFILTADKSEETECNGAACSDDAKFIAFDLFFKVDANTDLYLTTGSGVTTDDPTDTGIKNASRIAFVNLGTKDAGSSLSEIQGINSGTNVYIWEPNYDVHTPAGVAAAKDTYNITTTATGGTVIPYKGVKAEIASDAQIPLNSDNTTYFDDVTPTYTTVANFTEYQQIFSLSKGITKVRVYMWVEGQDVDCENNASGGNINFDIKFSTEKPADSGE